MSKLHLTKKTVEVLHKEGYKNKEDLTEAGIENLKKIDGVAEKDIEKLTKIITEK